MVVRTLVAYRPTCIANASCHYIRQVNGVKLADILFSLLSVCVSVRTHLNGQNDEKCI